MKTVSLTQRRETLVDTKFHKQLVLMGPWRVIKPGNMMYAYSNKHGYMHRVIWRLTHGDCPKRLDHRDRNGLNNQLDNLRPATRSQNLLNRSCQSNNTTGLKNVSFDKETGRFSARVQRQRKLIWLGRHDTAEIAAITVRDFVTTNDGQFARL